MASCMSAKQKSVYGRGPSNINFDAHAAIGQRFIFQALLDEVIKTIKIFLKKSRIGHVRYINIQAWLRGFRVKIASFSTFFCLSIAKRDLDTKKNNTKYKSLT